MKGVFILAAVAMLAAPMAASAGWVNEGVDPFRWPYHPNGGLGTYGINPVVPDPLNEPWNVIFDPIARPETMKAKFQHIQAAGAAIYSVGGWGAYTVYWELQDPGAPNGHNYQKWYFDNRQAHFSKYTLGGTPGTGTWEGAYGTDDTPIDTTPANPRDYYYQSVGLCGFNDGQNDRTPDQNPHSVGTDGPAAGAVADLDGDHNLELVWFGGWPRWGTPGDAYDPDTNCWSKISTPPPNDLILGRGAQVGSTFYMVNADSTGYWALDLGNPASWEGSAEVAMAGIINDYSAGWRSPGGSDVLITRTGLTYNYQDMTAKTVTAFTNNPNVGDMPEMVVWHDWLIVMQESDLGSGTVWAYDLTQGAGGTWTDTGVAGASPDAGSTATTYMNTIYWTVHGNVGGDEGTLFSITAADLGLTRTLGDVDANSVVNGLDLTAVLTAWETVPGHALWNPRADLDNNQIIDGLDLTEVISNWTPTAAAPPEPASGNVKRGKGNAKTKKK